jgi:16S rRNA A1518/A1519 N6-dimethyltransferase RsmA/KsgA/DIM1 with predicted DNA glycosylase/AP lyase activity
MSFVCPPWLSCILYNPVRKAFTDRKKVLAESGVTADSVVLEIGAGNGFFTEVLAEGAKKVYAVELQDAMIKKLRKRVQGTRSSVHIITGDIASLVMEEHFADVCLLYYSFHEVIDKIRAADNISITVKTGGILSIYEPTIEVGKLQMQKTVAMFEQRGFSKEIERNRLFTRFVKLRKRKPFPDRKGLSP